MGKKSLMGTAIAHLLKELGPDIPAEAEPQVENELSNKLRDILGDNWASLPVTGPYMMVSVLALNYILLPMGITPVTVADRVISKSKELELDTKFNELLASAKESANVTGEFTHAKVKELTEYSEAKGKEFNRVFKDLVENGQKLGKSVLDTGKTVSMGMFSNIRGKFKQSKDKEEDHSDTE